MTTHLKLAVWNANGLAQHTEEVKTFLKNQEIDIMLISETHFTKKSYVKIHNYSIYDTQHPDGNAHGGTAIIIRNGIKHHLHGYYQLEHIQSTSVTIEDWIGQLTVAAVYCPPKHAIKAEQFEHFYASLGQRFVAGGDYNAKHVQWGSRLTNPKGRELYKATQNKNLLPVSTGEPTYWPTDRRRIPDVIDICVVKGIPGNCLKAKSCLELSSDHSPVIMTVSSRIISKPKTLTLSSKRTNWECYREQIRAKLMLQVPLKTARNIEDALEHFVQTIQQAAWNSTPDSSEYTNSDTCSAVVKQKIIAKRKLRKQWHNTRSPLDKAKLNKAVKELKQLLHEERNRGIQNYLKDLTATEATEYSLWKATKRIKRPQIAIPPLRSEGGEWAKSDKEKAELFSKHLTKVFKPFDSELSEAEEKELLQTPSGPNQLKYPIKNFKISEIRSAIVHGLNPKKAPGYDLITGRILKELPDIGVQFTAQLFNAILKIEHFPSQWKVAQIIMIPKPGKPADKVESYRPISLLPVLSKLFEKLFLRRITPILEDKHLIPDHQFGFRHDHATIEQVHRVTNKISETLEDKNYCTAAFLDISQAFDKVWHTGLLHKIRIHFPQNVNNILKSYLENRHFLVKYQEEHTTLYPVKSGVPQGSVLGPVLYLLYTSDLPVTPNSMTATFADDTAVLVTHKDPEMATRILQNHMNKIQSWLQTWRIKANETKSVQVTFTMNRDTCPPVQFNNNQLPQADEAKYLGIHLDRRLTWRKHISTKRKQLALKLNKLYWVIGRRSQLSLESKLLVYKSIIKPIWTYGIQLWGSASDSNIEIIERFQSKVLRLIVDAPWYVPNEVIRRDLKVKTVKEEIRNYCVNYRQRLKDHPNKLTKHLFTKNRYNRRLKRYNPIDLIARF